MKHHARPEGFCNEASHRSGEYTHPKVRVMRESDYICLPEFCYQAIFIPEGIEPPPGREQSASPSRVKPRTFSVQTYRSGC
jgi:hypothetical protein